MFTKIHFHRFKQFNEKGFSLKSQGVSFLAGGNNSGKSSILHGLAVWQFCKTALEMEKGAKIFLATDKSQGLGLGDDEFSPITIPSLKYLWTNLRTSKENEEDGYTLHIGATWMQGNAEKELYFALSLTNDRLFIKKLKSNLALGDFIPTAAYLPPFAGITDREERSALAIRRRKIGQGLAGAVLRNTLLDFYNENQRKRTEYRGKKTKIKDSDLKELRENDPWEILQENLRETFSCELNVEEFREQYHSYIKINVVKGIHDRPYNIKKHPNYNNRDIMVEGSGFLQWLSVYSLLLDPSVDTILLDEPDAHLHFTLQQLLAENINLLCAAKKKQVLFATHSTEILRQAPYVSIFRVDRSSGKYLSEDFQKAALLAGLGTQYFPRLDKLKHTKRVIFVEGLSDFNILKSLALKAGTPLGDQWVPWPFSGRAKERKQVFTALSSEIIDLVAFSLNDRDDNNVAEVGADLIDKSAKSSDKFKIRMWRRRNVESYLLWPEAISRACNLSVDEITESLAHNFGLAVPNIDIFKKSHSVDSIMQIDGKKALADGSSAILTQLNANKFDVAKSFKKEEICDDILTLINEINFMM